MRIALLSAMDIAPDAEGTPRAFLPFIGRNIVSRQADIALSLGAERIVCLAGGPSQELTRVQHVCEKAGARFHLIAGARELSGIVRSADSLLVFGDGVVLADADPAQLLGDSQGVLTISADEGVSAGFERIDADRAWAGLLRTGGIAAEKLADMPDDVEPISALLRIALQSGAKPVSISDDLLNEGTLAVFETRAQIEHGQDTWLERNFRPQGWFSPGRASLDRIIGKFADRLMGRGLSAGTGLIVTAILSAIAVAVSWLSSPLAGFVVLIFVAVICAAFSKLSALESGTDDGATSVARTASKALTDIAIIAVAVAGISGGSVRGFPVSSIFTSLVLIAALRIVQLTARGGWTALFSDRIVLCVALALTSGLGLLLPALQLTALIALGTALFIGYSGSVRQA